MSHAASAAGKKKMKIDSKDFRVPAELLHDFLWRTSRALPEGERIGIFNRLVLVSA